MPTIGNCVLGRGDPYGTCFRNRQLYVQILALAAKRGNSVVEETLSILLDRRDPLNAETIANLTGPMCSAAVGHG
jgi:hypothetical protein